MATISAMTLEMIDSAIKSQKQADKKEVLKIAKAEGFEICALNAPKDVMNEYLVRINNELINRMMTTIVEAPKREIVSDDLDCDFSIPVLPQAEEKTTEIEIAPIADMEIEPQEEKQANPAIMMIFMLAIVWIAADCIIKVLQPQMQQLWAKAKSKSRSKGEWIAMARRVEKLYFAV